MGSVTCQMSISLDGFVAGPNQSIENPIGEGGMRLHQWMFDTASWKRQQGETGGARGADSDVVDGLLQGNGAYIMGRKMFGGGDGQWDESWTGWWGDEPPYHAPVFVLTHHPRKPTDARRDDLHLRHGRDRVGVTPGPGGRRRQGHRDRGRRQRRTAIPRGRVAR